MMNAEDYFELSMAVNPTRTYENTVELLTQAITLSPASAKYYYHRATAHWIAQNWSAAIEDYSEAIRLKPDPNDDYRNFTLDKAYDNRAYAYRAQGSHDAAIGDYTILIQQCPDNIYYYQSRSVAYTLKGDFVSSLSDLYTAQDLDPNNSLCLTLIADVYQRQGNQTAAMNNYNEAIERFGSSDFYGARGLLWKEQGNLIQAIADFEEAIQLNLLHFEAYLWLGEAYLANGDFIKALDILNRFMKHLPELNNIALPIRGHTYAAQGRVAEAIVDYKKSLELNSTHPDSDLMHKYILKHS